MVRASTYIKNSLMVISIIIKLDQIIESNLNQVAIQIYNLHI